MFRIVQKVSAVSFRLTYATTLGTTRERTVSVIAAFLPLPLKK